MVRRYVLEDTLRTNHLSKGGLITAVFHKPDHPISCIVMSTDHSGTHKAMKTMAGRRVRITIEIVDNQEDSPPAP